MDMGVVLEAEKERLTWESWLLRCCEPVHTKAIRVPLPEHGSAFLFIPGVFPQGSGQIMPIHE